MRPPCGSCVLGRFAKKVIQTLTKPSLLEEAKSNLAQEAMAAKEEGIKCPKLCNQGWMDEGFNCYGMAWRLNDKGERSNILLVAGKKVNESREEVDDPTPVSYLQPQTNTVHLDIPAAAATAERWSTHSGPAFAAPSPNNSKHMPAPTTPKPAHSQTSSTPAKSDAQLQNEVELEVKAWAEKCGKFSTEKDGERVSSPGDVRTMLSTLYDILNTETYKVPYDKLKKCLGWIRPKEVRHKKKWSTMEEQKKIVKKEYRQATKILHPDKHYQSPFETRTKATEVFKVLTSAFEWYEKQFLLRKC